MFETVTTIFRGVIDRLHFQATTYLPSLIAAGIVMLGAVIVAVVARSILYRIFKGAGIDRFMRRTGIAHVIDPTGRLRATSMAAEAAYWSILAFGVLAGLSVFGNDLTSQLIQGFVLMIPRLVIAALIVLAGAWLSQYLARWMLVWAFSERLPYPRRLAVAVRVIVFFTAIVVAADHLNFARSVFLTAFAMFAGGLVLTISLAFGIGASGRVREYLKDAPKRTSLKEKRPIWTHL
ncbi:MAG TPA: hypothetical protein VFR05_01925 [Terriglobia bacterium]|nr:hypothetical protein [Terriglobia bacterium]